MVNDSGTSRKAPEWLVLLLLVLLASAIRAWAVSTLHDDIRVSEPVIDGKLYLEQAHGILSGGNWAEGPFFQPPLYPMFLSGLFRLGPPSVATAYVAQSILGILSLVFLFLAVRRDFGSLAATIAGLLFVFYGPILAMESQILIATLLLFLATVVLWLWPHGRTPVWKLLAFGLSCGLMIAARGTFAVVPLIAGIVVWGQLPGTRFLLRVRRLIWLALGVVVPILPLSVYQSATTGDLQLLSLNGGLNLYIGNNPFARGIYSMPPGLDIQRDFTGRTSASIAAGRNLSLLESSHYWRDQSLEFVRTDPARAAWLAGRKLLLFLSPHEIPQIENFRHLASEAGPLKAAFLRFGWVLPLALLGLVLRGSSESNQSLRQRLGTRLPYSSLIAVGWIGTVLFFATGRFRIPVSPAFLVLAAVGVTVLWDSRRHRRRLLTGLVVAGSALLLQPVLPTYPVERADAYAAYQLGTRYAARAEHEEAIEQFSRALEHDPTMGQAWHSIGVAHAELGQPREAVSAYQSALEWIPTSAWTYFNLALCYGRLGDDESATQSLRAAAELAPNDVQVRHRLSMALGRTGRMEEALREAERAVSIDPTHQPSQELLELLRRGTPER